MAFHLAPLAEKITTTHNDETLSRDFTLLLSRDGMERAKCQIVLAMTNWMGSFSPYCVYIVIVIHVGAERTEQTINRRRNTVLIFQLSLS